MAEYDRMKSRGYTSFFQIAAKLHSFPGTSLGEGIGSRARLPFETHLAGIAGGFFPWLHDYSFDPQAGNRAQDFARFKVFRGFDFKD